MKKLLISMFLTALIVSGCGNSAQQANTEPQPAQGSPAADPVVIKFAHELREETPQHIGALEFQKLVEEKTQGQVKVEIYPAAQLGSEKEVMEMIQTGGIHSGMITTAVLSNLSPAFQMIDLPFLFPTRESVYHLLDGEVGEEILSTLASTNLVGAAYFESGFKQFTSNNPIEGPSDLSGLKFRTMESPLIIDTYRTFGANPVPISFPEVYNALQQKVVDGHENPLSTITTMKFYEVQKYVTLSNHSYLGYAVVFSKGWFDSLSPEIQDALKTAAKEAAKVEREAVVENEAKYIQTIKDSGTTVNEFTEEQTQQFMEAAKPVHEKYADVIGKELLDQAAQTIATFNK
ncbi:TRAP transporter substrate-binding protein [Ammoniphilus sp. YIM 78166]|uniref:TRAP transporter substrate-binding protein n=1 Tax=Ammoniphilus sp. YIM 78166 TaxID=1644106 RepID=UPI0010704312|nr:TRAP transporter substrate-binding protein [Ammoniphilus sp. YIM 78166]